jgi:diguanylate cyclase
MDDFGQFNATYGHTLGDRMLRSVAMTLSGSVALPEAVSRYGGDEFALLLPESNRAAAVALTAKIIEKLDALSVFETEAGERQGISVSVAVVSYPEDGSTREELLTAAEIALDQAKEERRAARTPRRELTPVQQLRLAGRRHPA